ncbi:AraC family transcriptional regulator [Mucilaginibacter paludis]|uniref:Transcriptional regulator, AraC family n=1 Tax=Mucilaginibacter paludis DSM 18603 TaxID=714943 RepID=H1XZT4_9SPHI|nr:AraC family transcriptional regulator [Mucilaginibacter paludis]EHQ27776.1 transcriptional regulator, AraC family [Mucilaginibacter paludis DSM 18603]
MKPQLLKVTNGPAHSFSIRQDTFPYINNHWHYHPEVELIHIRRGGGTQFIGDNIKRFNEGDVVLIGAHLPHYWRYDDTYFRENAEVHADAAVIHFSENFLGDQFLNLPESKSIKNLLEKAKRGIYIPAETAKAARLLIKKLLLSEGMYRIITLIELLSEIAACNNLVFLSSIGFRHDFNDIENERINAIYDYSLANFRKKIQLKEIAEVARISENSFCRYFKSRTRKTYSQFLIEIRVGDACKLLIEDRLSIKQICFECGFNNLVGFHKYFKLITGKSPLGYQREYTRI